MKRFLSITLAWFLSMTTSMALADEVNVISREEGSGTRGAFIELFGIEQKNEDGEKTEYATDDCDITNSTTVMMSSVAGNDCAIGYISLGSMNASEDARHWNVFLNDIFQNEEYASVLRELFNN